MRLPLASTILGGAALAAASVLLLQEPALARVASPDTASSVTRIRLHAGHHSAEGKLDELHILCTDDGDEFDVALPMSWIRFLVRHVEKGEGQVKLDDDTDLDLGLLWETIENLGPGEEIVIEDSEGRVAIWLE